MSSMREDGAHIRERVKVLLLSKRRNVDRAKYIVLIRVALKDYQLLRKVAKIR